MQKLVEKEMHGFFSMFPFFSAGERKNILENTSCRMYKKGETIIRDGEDPEGLVFLAQGKVKVFKLGVGNKEQIIRLAKAGSLLGFQAFLANDAYIASSKTIEPSVVCFLQHGCVQHLLQRNIRFSNALLHYIVHILRIANMRLMTLMQKHLRARLADSLLLLREVYGMLEEGVLNVDLSRENLARLSNMTASNATRTLVEFQKEGIIKLGDRRTIYLLNMSDLESISAQRW